ncbi:ATP-binding protein [Streptomyces sp. NPDC048106]|uniref:ATP-binding protein n=1 Tax=Streptomyces sp. NPDC048106 TaxID=3155750 RepID=UPI0034516753
MRGAVELRVTATPKAVPELRHQLRGYDYDVRLCATELLTNVIEHVGEGTPVRVRVVGGRRSGRTRVEVTDSDPHGMPTPLAATETEESGRGLVLVAALAERWGTERGPGGKTVWCELAGEGESADLGEVGAFVPPDGGWDDVDVTRTKDIPGPSERHGACPRLSVDELEHHCLDPVLPGRPDSLA